MPIETERKFVMTVPNSITFMSELITKYGGTALDITQGYLKGDARVRHIVPHADTVAEQHVFTYKAKVGGQIVEIETDISVHDYHKLWTIVDHVIHKTRVKVKNGDEVWEVDFFKEPKSGEIYLVMAEVELPEFVYEPKVVPPFISNYLLFAVPLEDRRFQNKKLADVDKVRKLVKSLKKEAK